MDFNFCFWLLVRREKKADGEEKKRQGIDEAQRKKRRQGQRQEATSGEKKEMAEHKVLQTFVFARVSSKEERR